MQRLSDAAKEGFTGVCPGPDEYKFRLFIEFEVSRPSGGGGQRSGQETMRSRTRKLIAWYVCCGWEQTDARSEKYGWLNTAMFVGSGVRSGRQGRSRGQRWDKSGPHGARPASRSTGGSADPLDPLSRPCSHLRRVSSRVTRASHICTG